MMSAQTSGVFAAHSTDGTDWSRQNSGVTEITQTTDGADRPFISAAGDAVAVAWWDTTAGHDMCARSTNAGVSWQTPVQVSSAAGWGSIPIVVSAEEMYVAWQEGAQTAQIPGPPVSLPGMREPKRSMRRRSPRGMVGCPRTSRR